MPEADTDPQHPTDAPEVAPEHAPAVAPSDAESSASLELSEQAIQLRVEAALLTAERPLSAGKLGEALGGVPEKSIDAAIASLNTIYDDSARSFRIEAVAGGYRVMTRPEFADVLANLSKSKAQSKLSPAALETLAIIAYKQPILRADLEAIRGVACGEVLRSLLERHLIKITGRAEEIGRPMLYGTTHGFLEVFGLTSLKELPKIEELSL